MHDCASISDSIANNLKTSSHYSLQSGSLHHCSFSQMVLNLYFGVVGFS